VLERVLCETDSANHGERQLANAFDNQRAILFDRFRSWFHIRWSCVLRWLDPACCSLFMADPPNEDKIVPHFVSASIANGFN
jgi:hypothetical protein